MNIMDKVKKFWKGILCAVVLLGVSGGFMAYVFASNEPVINITPPASGYIYNTGDTDVLLATISNLTIPSGSSVTNVQLMAGNLFWYTDNSQVVGFVKPDGTVYSQNEVVKGASVSIKATKAGKANIYVRYYYNKNDHTEIVDANNLSNYAYVTAELRPFQVNLDVSSDYDAYIEDKIYDGTGITFRTNAYTNDPVMIEASNSVVRVEDALMNDGSVSYDTKNVYITGGGKSEIIVRTTSGRDVTISNKLIEGLYKTFTLYGKVNFGTSANNYRDYYANGRNYKYIEIDTANYGITTVLSNIITDSNAEVSYTTSDSNVAYMDNSAITPVGAGIAMIQAGVMQNGQFMTYRDADGIVNSYDTIYVRVPLMWAYGNGYVRNYTINMGIDDQYTLKTNAGVKTVSYESSDTSVATVSADGLIKAVSKGTAVITAKVSSSGSDSNATYTDEITMTVTVGDTFSMSTTYYEMNIGDTHDIQVTTSSKEPVVFSINGVKIDGTNVPDGLEGVVDTDDGTILHLTATKSGTYTIVATQTTDGLVKTARATVYVREAVSGITITPSEVTIPVGGQYTLNAVISPGTAFNKDIIWVSSDMSKLTVEKTSDYEAVVTGVEGGTVTVTAVSAADGKVFATATVHITDKVTGVLLNETSLTVDMNSMKQYQLVATVLPSNISGVDDGIDRTVTWKSSDTSVLTVNEDGLVTFVAPGYASVEVKTNDGGFTELCNFTVTVPVESVKILHDNITDLQVGQSVGLSAEVLPLTATNRTVKWSSSDEKICTVDTNGTITAVAPGDVVIWCNALADGNINDYITVHIIEPVSGVTLNIKDTTVKKGTVFWLYATVYPVTAEYKDIEWSSSDPEIATVESDGKVTAIKPGKVTITALNRQSGNSDTCVVTVTESVISITLKTGTSETMFVGAKYTIVPEVLPVDAEDKSVTYMSSDETVATVDANGVVTALKGGECDIVVTTNDRQLTAYCHITVKEYVSSITFDSTFKYINVNTGSNIAAVIQTDTASNKSLIWKSSDSSIVSVNGQGEIWGNKLGTAVITATAADGGGAIATCVVQVVEPVIGIKLNPTTLNMYQGDTKIISASVTPSAATVKALSWTSSDESVAKVDEDGEVTAVAPGKCKITATSVDGNNVTAVTTVYVKATVNATALTVTPDTVNMKVGQLRSLTARTTPSTITEGLAWLTSDPTVVTVDGNGTIAAIGEGTATITVYGRVSGVQATCAVTVTSAVNKATSIKLNTNELVMLSGKTMALQYRLLPTDSVERVNWISSDPAVATVDSDGRVTAVAPGICNIIAQTSVGGLETTCTIYSMGLSKTSMTLQQYDPFTLYVDGIPSGQTISWRTGNARIATVSSSGEVIGRKAGTTTITATVDNKTLTCVVKIIDATKD